MPPGSEGAVSGWQPAGGSGTTPHLVRLLQVSNYVILIRLPSYLAELLKGSSATLVPIPAAILHQDHRESQYTVWKDVWRVCVDC